MTKRTFRELFAEAEKDPVYWTERAILHVTEEVFLAMERAGISRADLARRLDTTPAYVTKILRGRSNFTLDSLTRLARALGGELRVHIAPQGSETRWFDVLSPLPDEGLAWSSEAVAEVSAESSRSASWVGGADGQYSMSPIPAGEVREVSDGDTAVAA